MDERFVAASGCLPTRTTLRIGAHRYPILSEDRETCLIRAPEGAALRGFADIYDGDSHRARCLVMLSAPEGDLVRLTYKQRTAVCTAPPADYAAD